MAAATASLLFVFLLAPAFAVKLAAYDCSSPSSTKFLAHHSCHEEDSHHSAETFTVAQFNNKRNITGFRCSIHMTAQVGYCGHYSATKLTDQSEFNMPLARLRETL